MNRVWIELEKPKNDEEAATIVEEANNMLRRLGPNDDEFTTGRFGWDAKRKQFTYGTPMGYENLVDRGQWFNLSYLGRAL